jgi:antitoxin component YwqK of YwqJK toxin-antitoxin module
MDNKFTAIKYTYKNDILIQVEYLNDKNELHRDNDLPACFQYFESGNVCSKIWYKNGQISRDGDKPSMKIYLDIYSKISNSKYWHKNGILHRDNDLPAKIMTDNEGHVDYEMWYQNGELHRPIGPAFIEYSKNKIIKENYYLNGALVEKPIDKISKFDEKDIIKCLEILEVMKK